jgi:cytochrome c oxidase subunit 4
VSTVEHEHDHGHGGEHGGLEHAHPGAKTYTLIGLVLAIITLAEVFFYTQESVRAFLVPLLLVLSASKFALVVGFYMHLRFDHPLFTGVFGFGLIVAASVITALMFLFGQYPLPTHTG